MSSLISLGSFNANNGKTSGLGLASGLDSNALIDAILKARKDSVTAIEDKITLNGKKSAAISTLSTLISRLQTTADFLRSPPGVGNEDSDFFEHTTTSISSSTTTAASAYLAVTSESGATVSSYRIEDITVAKEHILRRSGFTDDSTSVVGGALDFNAGTFTLRGVSVTLEEGDTLLQIKAKVNAVSTTSGVTAEIVQVSDTSYTLVLKALETGVDNDITEYGGATIVFGADAEAFTESQPANDSSFTLDGVTITRSSNTISDALDKLTFTLISDTGVADPTLTLSVSHDTDIIQSGVNDFVTAYNELRYFISQQSKRDENGELVEDAVLGDDNILRDVLVGLQSQVSGVVSGLASGDVKSLFDVGIDSTTFPGDDTTPKTEGILVLDVAKFTAAIAADFNKFRKVFSQNFTANSADIGVFKTSNKATLTNFKLDIDTSRAVGSQVMVLDATTDAFLFYMDFKNGLITGNSQSASDGSTLDGLQLVYTGDGTDIITATNTNGIMSKTFNTLSNFLVEDTGLIDVTLASLADQDELFQDNVDKENINIEVERQLLVDKFSKLETVISQANSVLSFLEAQRNSNNSSNG